MPAPKSATCDRPLPPPSQELQPVTHMTATYRRFLLPALPMLAAALMACASGPLCYRLGEFTACSQADSGYKPSIVCPNPSGQPWSCPAGIPSLDQKVQRCPQTHAGEYGRTVCNDTDQTSRCVWKKPVCGPNPGDCSLEANNTDNQVNKQVLAGEECVGSGG